MSSKTSQSPEQIPNLDTIISQITQNDQFKGMMDSFSDDFKKTVHAPGTEESDLESESEPNSSYDLMATFFSDQDGNNICDILSNINNNLSKLNDNLSNRK